ncbi:MAG: sulfite exporter TauE/SafE family protein [Myxococcales bacterium]|nr:sulfite exporter TauE/SafE family protein [Myxococcales bacterium]MCB9712337.1 sulfite exporter TauE/SafE family protein [Myxococcales bacterium]
MSSLGLGAVFLASLLGSVHCVAMCGGFAAVAAGGGSRWPVLAYQLGRLLGYLGLGVAAGLLGASLDLAGESLMGLQRIAGVLTGIALVVMAVVSLMPGRKGVDPSLVSLGTGPAKAGTLRRLWLGGLRRGGVTGSLVVGLGSALLPCGWLWGYVLVAASTGSSAAGAVVMAAFWAGALPALLSVGMLAGWLRQRLGPRAPRLVAGVMLVLGVLALVGKLGPAPTAAPDDSGEPGAHSCHHS